MIHLVNSIVDLWKHVIKYSSCQTRTIQVVVWRCENRCSTAICLYRAGWFNVYWQILGGEALLKLMFE
jgi:hypothetical protein